MHGTLGTLLIFWGRIFDPFRKVSCIINYDVHKRLVRESCVDLYNLVKYYQPFEMKLWISSFQIHIYAWLLLSHYIVQQTCIDRLPRRKWFWWKYRLYIFRVHSFSHKLLKTWIFWGLQNCVFALSISALLILSG